VSQWVGQSCGTTILCYHSIMYFSLSVFSQTCCHGLAYAEGCISVCICIVICLCMTLTYLAMSWFLVRITAEDSNFVLDRGGHGSVHGKGKGDFLWRIRCCR